MANVLSIAGIILGTILAMTTMLVWTARMLPRPVERASQRISEHPVVCFVFGIVVLAAAGGLAMFGFWLRPTVTEFLNRVLDAVAETTGIFRFRSDVEFSRMTLIWITLTPFLAAIAIGYAGFARLFEHRIKPDMNHSLSSITAGAFFSCCPMFMPYIGWYLYFPVFFAISAGAGTWGILSRGSLPRIVST